MTTPEFQEAVSWAGAASLWAPALVSASFALLAHWLRGVTTSGAFAGAVIAFVLYAAAGRGAFLLLVVLFVLTWLATLVGYRKKQGSGTVEDHDGRTASQVLANLGAAGVCALLYRLCRENPLLMLAFLAAISEAAADTVSSEIGRLASKTAVLITTWEQVPAGTDGGISLWGTLAGVSAAGLIGIVSGAIGLTPWNDIGIPVAVAVCGMFVDSLLGAGLERRGWLNNDAVNFISTCVAAGLCLFFG